MLPVEEYGQNNLGATVFVGGPITSGGGGGGGCGCGGGGGGGLSVT